MSREGILMSLLNGSANLDAVASQLAGLPWDSNPLVKCLPIHLKRVLDRFVAGVLSEKEIEMWANFVEGRDDIEIEPPLRDIIFELANPLITKRLTLDRAREILEGLRG